MKSVAVIITVFNRIEKTIACLDSLYASAGQMNDIKLDVWITDDGSTDGTGKVITERYKNQTINILQGEGNLFWNGGMIKAWSAAVKHSGYDGYLWLNNDSVILPNLWEELVAADDYSKDKYGKHGIYVASLTDMAGKKLSYGGFVFINRITLKDKFLVPNGTFQECECAHGNITYVSSEVVEDMGIFCDKYVHGGADHDYTYRAQKAGWPLFILRDYVGKCDNDHKGNNVILSSMKLSERIKYLKSPLGLNLNNTLLFQKRCFPWRYPFVLVSGYAKALFPRAVYGIRRIMWK